MKSTLSDDKEAYGLISEELSSAMSFYFEKARVGDALLWGFLESKAPLAEKGVDFV